MVYTTNEDVPGIIGTLGQTMGQNGVNIANFTLGRSQKGKDAIALLYVDDPVPGEVLDALRETGLFQQVRALAFEVA
jgi:D-3-phosphoglycerate dehydrogenase